MKELYFAKRTVGPFYEHAAFLSHRAASAWAGVDGAVVGIDPGELADRVTVYGAVAAASRIELNPVNSDEWLTAVLFALSLGEG